MIGKILLIGGAVIGIAGMSIWYLLLKNYLKKNEGKHASEVEPTIKNFMAASSVIAVLFFLLSVSGIILSNYGI